MSKIVLTNEVATPTTPISGTTVIYTTTGGVLQVLNSSGTPVAPLTTSIFTATGQLLYASGASTPAVLNIGATKTVLRVNGAGTDPEWFALMGATPPAALGGAAAPGTSDNAARLDHVHALPVSAQGDIMYANSASTVTSLPIGASGRFLRVNGTATAPEWFALMDATPPAALGVAATPGTSDNAARLDHVHPFPTASDVGAVALSTVTAAGDLIYGNGVGTVTQRAIGAAGQVLTVNSGAPEWLDPPTFVAGTPNSTAQYRSATAIQAAITAAAAAITGGLTAATVEILPGVYTGNLTIPANVSLVASGGFGSVSIIGTVTLTATLGRNSLSGLYIEGQLICNAGVATTAEVPLNQCYIDTNGVAFPAITVSDDGWVIRLDGCTLDSSTSAGQNTVTLATDPSDTELSAKNCTFNTQATGLAISGSLSDGTFEGCTFNRPFAITTSLASSLQLTNTVFNLTSTPSTVVAFAGVGSLALNILGSFGISGLAVAGTLFTGAVTASAGTTGTFLGTYQTANLPILAPGSPNGVLAYSSDNNALYVRRSAAWEKVASASNETTWTATQTFNETVFNRAASPASANDTAGTYTFTNNTDPPLIRMTTGGGPQTVNLFAPASGDIGKQWVIFDAGRNSAANNITINPNGFDTINGVNAPVTISTNGGALVFRVTAVNAWETIGY